MSKRSSTIVSSSARDRLQVAAHPGLVCDDPGVLRVGLALAAVDPCGMVHGPSRDVEDRLAMREEGADQQRRPSLVQVRGPVDLPVPGQGKDVGDQGKDRVLGVGQPPGEQPASVLVYDHAVVVGLACVDSGPQFGHKYAFLFRSFWRAHGQPRRHFLTQRSMRISQSAVESSVGRGRPFRLSHGNGENEEAIPAPLGGQKPTEAPDPHRKHRKEGERHHVGA
nr:hypothetical protein [Sinomonas notoginsengisoli]